jgi:hypothetical protein
MFHRLRVTESRGSTCRELQPDLDSAKEVASSPAILSTPLFIGDFAKQHHSCGNAVPGESHGHGMRPLRRKAYQ